MESHSRQRNGFAGLTISTEVRIVFPLNNGLPRCIPQKRISAEGIEHGNVTLRCHKDSENDTTLNSLLSCLWRIYRMDHLYEEATGGGFREVNPWDTGCSV